MYPIGRCNSLHGPLWRMRSALFRPSLERAWSRGYNQPSQSMIQVGSMSSRSPSPSTMSMYTQLAEIPSPIGAQFLSSSGDTIQVTYSVRNHAKNVKRTMGKTIFVPTPNQTTGTTPPALAPVAGPLLDTNVIAQVVSPSGAKRAVWRKTEKDRFVEVWEGETLAHQWLVTDVHGEVYTDEYFSSFCFSPSETSIIYVAEQKTPEIQDPFAKFRFTPDFGEGLIGKRRPGIFILQCEEGSESEPILVQPGRPNNDATVNFGQPVFSALADDILYATGYEYTVDGKFLGIKGCFNRPSGIWQLNLNRDAVQDNRGESGTDSDKAEKKVKAIDAQCTKLTPAHLSCRSPRTHTQNGKHTLFWLACRSGGAHLATSMIHTLDITDERRLSPETKRKELVGIVDVPSLDVHAGFPGLYPEYNFAAVPFLQRPGQAAPSIVIDSIWGSRKTILRVDGDTGAVVDLTPPGSRLADGDAGRFSWSLLGTDGRRRLLCSRSSPAVPYEVLTGVVQESGDIAWRVVDRPSVTKAVADALRSVKTSVLPIPGRGGSVETILIQGSNGTRDAGGSKPPCITSPHGGPHGTSLETFMPLNTALVHDGYTLSLPNYTGSPGYGEVFLQELVGKCGDLDIEDTMASARYLIEQGVAEEGPGKQFLMGGSHGGFVTAHLIGKYPDFFSAAILRNPVISAGEITNTDIPDWYFSEFGYEYSMNSSRSHIENSSEANNSTIPPLISASMFAQLQAMSPIAAVDAIKIPVLLLIGAADRRVAPSQGMGFYHALKARYAQAASAAQGRPSKLEMLVFDGEGHPIDGVEAGKACAEASVQWFAQAQELST